VRLIPLNRVPDGATLGKDVASGRPDGMPLLRRGSTLSPKFVSALLKAGIHAVYIDDPETEGIDPTAVLSDETRAAATAAVSKAFETASASFASGQPLTADAIGELEAIAARMAREIGEINDFALALGDLSAADGYTLQHSVDVAALGLLIGQRLFKTRGYRDYMGRQSWQKLDQRMTRLGLGLLLHDVGKLAVPQEILNKPGKLDPAEWEIMKSHPVAGTELLRSDLISPLIKVIVRSHHERWEGGGYPDRKSELDIHELARIAAVADVYDAVTSERVYAAARPPHIGVRIIREGRGTAFDAEIVDVFSEIVAPFPPGHPIDLDDGRSGVVAEVLEGHIDRPVVRVLNDGAPYEVDLTVQRDVLIVGWEDMDPTSERVPARA
jgi:HD-GYP domain-containing protein (c-di-GMP phosphodiesterase class II)